MLNPGAIEFKPRPPLQTSISTNDSKNVKLSTNPKESQQQCDDKATTHSHKPRKQKIASHTASTTAAKHPHSTSKDHANDNDGNSNIVMNEGTTSAIQKGDHSKAFRRKQSSKQKTPTALSSTQQQKQGQQQQQPRKTGRQVQRRSVSHTSTNAAAATPAAATLNPDEHEPTTSFITIDQTIDPVHIIPGALALKNTVTHGYDRYIAWIERCLQAHAVVTIVGMDPAISDVLSLVTIIQSKGIGSYHELATFSMENDSGRQQQNQISGIQFKLHRN